MWWWKRSPGLETAMQEELLDELEGRTKAGVRADQKEEDGT
jgi:hypothetical protein